VEVVMEVVMWQRASDETNDASAVAAAAPLAHAHAIPLWSFTANTTKFPNRTQAGNWWSSRRQSTVAVGYCPLLSIYHL